MKANKLANYTMVLLLAVLVGFSGCEKEEKIEQPTLPDQLTMQMTYSDFSNTKKSLALNKARAVIIVGAWQTITTATMAIPVAAFVEAFKHTPEQVSDNTWEWTYGVQNIYSVRLKAVSDGVEVNWTMYVSYGNYKDYVWYTGKSKADNSSGEWHLNFGPEQNKPFLDITWTRDASDNFVSVKYVNVIPGDAGNGSYIDYGKLSTGAYNRYYNIYGKAENKTIAVEWNNNTKNGRIKDSSYEGGGWFCWNEQGADGNCPN